MIWNERYETMEGERLRELQGQRLRELVEKLYRRVPFYREKMDGVGVRPADIRSIEDLPRLPFTTKEEMREVYPLKMLAVDLGEIVEVHTSSGTTGKPVVDAYTAGGHRPLVGGDGPLPVHGRGDPRRTWCRTPTATGCSPAAWACTTGRGGSARRSSPSPAATPRGSS